MVFQLSFRWERGKKDDRCDTTQYRKSSIHEVRSSVK